MITSNLTTEQYDMADRIDILLEKNPGRTFTPSEITRKIKADIHCNEVRDLLEWMVREVMLDSTGNGCWKRYTARSRFAHLR